MQETGKLIHRVMINAPIQDVWDILTKEGEQLPFFFNTVLHTTTLAPGAPVRMRSKNGKTTAVVGDVLELDPPHKYVMTFKFTAYDDPACKVTHLLEETDEGTQYTLITEHIPPGTKTEKQMAQGAEFITKTLKSLAETGKVPVSSKMILTLIALTEWTAPKSSRSENWPLEKRIELPNEQ